MVKRGRPRIKIDLELAKSLAGIQCTIKEISAVMDIPASTLQERPDFRLVYQKGIENGKASLRRIQYKLAQTSAGMAIFLGKNYLGQKDTPLIDQSQHTHYGIFLHNILQKAGLDGQPAVNTGNSESKSRFN